MAPPDIAARLFRWLPDRWFPVGAPVVTALLAGFADALSLNHAQITYARLQTRLATATGGFLDLFAWDFFGPRIGRRAQQSDDAFRACIRRELFRARGTRAALRQAVADIAGHAPWIFEPANATDTGGYNVGGVGYGAAGGYGSLQLPFQCFVQAQRPTGGGIAGVAGYGSAAGGYGGGAIEYGALTMVADRPTDADIYAAVADVMPIATIAWTAITGTPVGGVTDVDDFILDVNTLA